MLENVLIISLSMSVVIGILLLLVPVMDKRYYAKFRYVVWILIAIRLIIPYSVEFKSAPVTIPSVPDFVIVDSGEEKESSNVVSSDTNVSDITNTAVPTNIQDVPSAAPSKGYEITLNEVITFLWAVGAMLFVLWHTYAYIAFKNKIKKDFKRTDDYKKLPVFVCAKVDSPMLIGFLKPMIILPQTLYNEKELSVVLKHEYTHYKRKDLWIKLVLLLANAMHFFNPLVYFMVRQANRDMEFSCDDTVLKDEGIVYRKEYSMTILKTMERNNK